MNGGRRGRMFTARSPRVRVPVHLGVRERLESWTGPEGHDLMALTSAPPAGSRDRAADDDTSADGPPPPPAPPAPAARPLRPVTPRAIAVAAAAWLVVTVVAVPLVLYGVGPLLEQRDQTELLSDYRVEIRQAAAQTNGLPGVELPTRAPETGSPVAILDIPEMKLEQVVVEGVGPQQTRRGPGHVPGTAGPGQPGNSAIVARRSTFGGPFRPLGSLETGDEILVTTTQGQSIYVVTEVRSDEVADGSGTRPQPADAGTTTTTAPPADEAPVETETALDAALPEGALTTDDLYGRTDDDRLTLVTSAATRPVEHGPGDRRDRGDAGPAVPAHAAVGAHGPAGRPRRRRQRVGATGPGGARLPGGGRRRRRPLPQGPPPLRLPPHRPAARRRRHPHRRGRRPAPARMDLIPPLLLRGTSR